MVWHLGRWYYTIVKPQKHHPIRKYCKCVSLVTLQSMQFLFAIWASQEQIIAFATFRLQGRHRDNSWPAAKRLYYVLDLKIGPLLERGYILLKLFFIIFFFSHTFSVLVSGHHFSFFLPCYLSDMYPPCFLHHIPDRPSLSVLGLEKLVGGKIKNTKIKRNVVGFFFFFTNKEQLL